MYKLLMIGLPLLITGYAAYYFNSSGGGDLLVKAFSGNADSKNGVSAVQVYSGTYLCGENSGCQKPSTLLLEDDTTFEWSYSDEEQGEMMVAHGTWGVGKGGKLIFLVEKEGSLPSMPSSLFAKAGMIEIAEFAKGKNLFDWMSKSPSFKRVKNEGENTQEQTTEQQQSSQDEKQTEPKTEEPTS